MKSYLFTLLFLAQVLNTSAQTEKKEEPQPEAEAKKPAVTLVPFTEELRLKLGGMPQSEIPVFKQPTQEQLRALGGIPESELKGLKRQTPEELALRKKADDLKKNLTEEQLQKYADTDPELILVYAVRMKDEVAVSRKNGNSWFEIVDRDIFRRPYARELFSRLLHQGLFPENRFCTLNWFHALRPVPWAKDFLDEAVRLYHQDKQENHPWTASHIRGLGHLIMEVGDESHRKVLDELDATGESYGGYRSRLEHRINLKNEMEAHKPEEAPPAVKAIQPVKQTRAAPAVEKSEGHIAVILTGVVAFAAVGFLLWLMRR